MGRRLPVSSCNRKILQFRAFQARRVMVLRAILPTSGIMPV